MIAKYGKASSELMFVIVVRTGMVVCFAACLSGACSGWYVGCLPTLVTSIAEWAHEDCLMGWSHQKLMPWLVQSWTAKRLKYARSIHPALLNDLTVFSLKCCFCYVQ